MPDYDSILFTPPAPVARVSLRNIETGLVCADVPMLIDLGADATFVPQAIADFLEIKSAAGKNYEVEGFDKSKSTADVVLVEMTFLNKRFRGQFLLTENEYGFLGRNVLNAVRLMFDGPQLIWDEYRP